MNDPTAAPSLDDKELLFLRSLAAQYPNIVTATAQIASLRAQLTLPKGTIHVISDIHGEAKKLLHIVHNASGHLRPVVEGLFNDRLTPEEIQDLLTLIYYPRESFPRFMERLPDPEQQREWFRQQVRCEFEVMRAAAERLTIQQIDETFPAEYRRLFRDLFFERHLPGGQYDSNLLATLIDSGLALEFLRHVSRVIRNLSVRELIVAGDFGDRGPRIDQVIETVMRQPRVAITWGNHDMTWMGACLGHPLLIASVLRISLRYRRLSQIEEGYGIIMSPLEKLARECYGDDPAAAFQPKGTGLRETLTMARMQKAAAVLEFKLEAQAILRNPHFGMGDRILLDKIDFEKGTVRIGEQEYPLKDGHFPTVDPTDPLALSAEEESCLQRIRESFLASDRLWQQMLFIKDNGGMSLIRDGNLIFHGCLPVDPDGRDLPMQIDGQSYSGVSLMRKLNSVVHRAFRERRLEDLDLLWYLWAGPRSPLFGKDKMATFERYLVEDKATHKETKNSYFKLIHQAEFCERILREFGVDPETGLIVNGHVPVKVEEGEDPVKQSGRAITIDGAFSEAYGDHGFTLVLDSRGVSLARHSHFESVEEAVANGTDIIPQVRRIRDYPVERRVEHTEEGAEIRQQIDMLDRLVTAFRENLVPEKR